MKNLPWSTIPEILEELKQNTCDGNEGIKKFVDVLDGLDVLYDVRILSDFPAYDIYFINYYMAEYLHRLPMTYIHGDGSRIRMVIDTDSYQRGVMGQDSTLGWVYDSDTIRKFDLEISAKSSHYPDDDAEHIYELYTKLGKALN